MEGTSTSRNKERKQVSETTARGVIGLMALIFVFQAVTFILHKCQTEAVTQTPEARAADSAATGNRLFDFNPNTIGADSLQMLGFSEKQALTIIHYRQKGGRFRKKEDFSKMYVVSPEKYAELEPHIKLPDTKSSKETVHDTPAKAKDNVKSPKPVTSAKHTKAETSVNYPKTETVKDSSKAEDKAGNAGLWSGKNYNNVCIDLNEADSAALRSVRGIGEYFCKAILSYRKALGSFASTEQLLEIRGMDQQKFNRIKDQVFVHPGGIRKFSIAESEQSFLARHPYIGAYNARGIALFLQSHSKEECTLKALFENKILSAQDTLRLHPYILN